MVLKLVLLFTLAVIAASEKSCNKNTEIHSDCLNPCQPTCQRPVPATCYFIVCNEGCACKTGFVLNRKMGRCVPAGTCRKYCGKNQEFTTCGSACPITCQNPETSCTDNCVVGCFCKEGTTFDEITEECVEKCPSA